VKGWKKNSHKGLVLNYEKALNTRSHKAQEKEAIKH